MYKRAHHQHVFKLLQALDGALLEQTECYFGGGTAIVLSLDEYRESGWSGKAFNNAIARMARPGHLAACLKKLQMDDSWLQRIPQIFSSTTSLCK